MTGEWDRFVAAQTLHNQQIRARLDALETALGKTGAGDQGGGQMSASAVDGTVIATLTGKVTLSGGGSLAPLPVLWSRIRGDYGATTELSRIQMPWDGFFTLTWTIKGLWPRGFHRYDEIDGVSVQVLNDPDDPELGGNMNAKPLLTRAHVNAADFIRPAGARLSHGTITGYGNSIALALTGIFVHQEPIDGVPFGQPTGIQMDLIVTSDIQG